MSEENETTGGSVPTWTEGPSVDSMSADDAQSEIQSIEKDPSFAGEGKMDFWSRQNMLKRRDALYKHSLGESGEQPYNFMAEVLEKQGVTEESLKAEQEKFAQRDYDEQKKKTMDALTTHFGTEDDAKQAITEARQILDRFARPEDMLFLDQSGLGNSPELIEKLAEINRIFAKGGGMR